jgi:hydrogenase maturation protease
MRGDDGAGSLLIERIAGRVNAVCLDTGVAPENFLGTIAAAQPQTVLLVDAMSGGGAAGEIRILKPEDAGGGLSTHALSLKLTAEYLRARTGAEVLLIGIQAGRSAFGDQLSAPVADAVNALAEMLKECCPVA